MEEGGNIIADVWNCLTLLLLLLGVHGGPFKTVLKIAFLTGSYIPNPGSFIQRMSAMLPSFSISNRTDTVYVPAFAPFL